MRVGLSILPWSLAVVVACGEGTGGTPPGSPEGGWDSGLTEAGDASGGSEAGEGGGKGGAGGTGGTGGTSGGAAGAAGTGGQSGSAGGAGTGGQSGSAGGAGALGPGLHYGINTHAPQGKALTTLYDKVQAAHIGWVRVDFNWFMIETAQDHFDWHVFDAVAQAAQARGLRIFATLAYTPGWANGGQEGKVPPGNPDDWYDFCYRAVERYDGNHGQPRIDHWGLWNEPDHSGFFEGSSTDYVSTILQPGSKAIRKASPTAKVLAPDLAHDEDFLVDVLAKGKDAIDIVTLHMYAETPAEVLERFDGPHWPWDPKNFAEILADAGVFGIKPVWLTETGWPTPAGWDCWFQKGVSSEGKQAARYTELLDRLWTRDWITNVFFYELHDADLEIACQWGMLRGDFSEKQAYGAYRDYILAHPATP